MTRKHHASDSPIGIKEQCPLEYVIDVHILLYCHIYQKLTFGTGLPWSNSGKWTALTKIECMCLCVQHEMIPGVSKDQEALLIALKRPIIFILPAAFDKGMKFA